MTLHSLSTLHLKANNLTFAIENHGTSGKSLHMDHRPVSSRTSALEKFKMPA